MVFHNECFRVFSNSFDEVLSYRRMRSQALCSLSGSFVKYRKNLQSGGAI